ncbi:MAG: transglycosylase domain-containing protein [Microbacteriaceae bacterium]|nr:transglycosylase domain-containing protein [Microbacteriaceae bacterium]
MSDPYSKPFGAVGAFLGFLGFSVLAGVLVTAMITPAIAVTSITANNTVGVFQNLPEYVTINQQSQRNVLYAMRGGQPVPFAQVYDQNRQEVAWTDVSQFAKDAAVAGEDQRFYEHGGVDLAGIARAVVSNITSGGKQGASTLDQQLVKNLMIQQALTLPTAAERTAAVARAQAGDIERKLKEAKLAIGLEKQYTKQEILLGYLNIAFFGGTTYGIESASELYYSTTAKNLTLAQAASLIAIVQDPAYRNPEYKKNWPHNQSRRDAILRTMLTLKKVTKAQFDEAVATPVNETTVKITQPSNGCNNAAAAKTFCDYVIKNVKNFSSLGATPVERAANWKKGGFKVYTTLDLDMQEHAEGLLAAQTPATESRFQLGSAVSTLQVGTGRILIMAQNKSFNDTGAGGGPTATAVNYNSDIKYGGSSGFQVGSAYKLFTLINWLQNGHGLQEYVDGSAPQSYKVPSKCEPNHQPYLVKNDGNSSGGRMSVMQATAGSVNAAFVYMASKLDMCDIRDVAASMGVHRADGGKLQTYGSSVLGTDEISPLAIANAYATVANNGVLCQPVAVDKIVGADGKELPGQVPDCAPAISPDIAAAAAVALQGVMNGGTGSPSNPRDGTPLIGKTGTADAFQTWILSASTKVATAVWVGNIVGKQNLRQINVAGGAAATARHRIMKPLQAWLDDAYPGGAAFPVPSKALVSGVSQPVPVLAGQTSAAAQALLETLNLSYTDGGPIPSELPVGTVVSSDPAAGSLVSKGTNVTVYTSDGTLAATVPNVVEKKLGDAMALLVAAGFPATNITVSYQASDPKVVCLVTASNPPAGTASSKITPIALTVNAGVIVPGVAPKCS